MRVEPSHCVLFMCACICSYVFAGAHGGQKGTSDPLDLELEAFVSCLISVLGSELGPFGTAVSALNHRTIFLDLVILILK